MAICTRLSSFHILKFQGVDTDKYLQGQITTDIAQLTSDNVQFACQCDSKGKVISTFYLLRQQDAVLLIGFAESLQLSLAAFKKFAVFSQVEITDVSEQIALFGFDATALPASIDTLTHKASLPAEPMQVSRSEMATILRLPGESARYLLLTEKGLSRDEQQGIEQDWLAADIQAGIAHLHANASGEYIPQMLNLQALQAISFTKGCYMGQETVARAKYLGKNKRAGFILSVKTDACVSSDEIIEMQMGENWRRAGTIATIVSNGLEGNTWIFAVMPNDLEPETVLRLKSMPDSRLNIHSLPYSVE